MDILLLLFVVAVAVTTTASAAYAFGHARGFSAGLEKHASFSRKLMRELTEYYRSQVGELPPPKELVDILKDYEERNGQP